MSWHSGAPSSDNYYDALEACCSVSNLRPDERPVSIRAATTTNAATAAARTAHRTTSTSSTVAPQRRGDHVLIDLDSPTDRLIEVIESLREAIVDGSASASRRQRQQRRRQRKAAAASARAGAGAAAASGDNGIGPSARAPTTSSTTGRANGITIYNKEDRSRVNRERVNIAEILISLRNFISIGLSRSIKEGRPLFLYGEKKVD